MAIPPFGSVPGYSKGNFTVKPTLSDLAVLGTEILVSPGNFNNSADWTLGTGWVGSASTATATAATSSVVATAGNLNVPIVAGSYYRVQFRVSSYSAGTLQMQVGGTVFNWGTLGTAAGFGFFVVIIATDTTGFQFNGSAFTGAVTGLSLKLITPANAPFTVLDSTGAVAFQLRDDGAANNSFGFGVNSLRSLTVASAADMVALGTNSLGKNVTGTGNIGIGFNALSENSLANNNVAIGPNALQHNVKGTGQVGIGSGALQSNVVGISNIGIGLQAGNAVTSGSNNVLLGPGAGAAITTGSGNICIGGVDVATPTTSNAMNIENVFFGDMSGAVKLGGVGITPPTSVLQVGGAIATPIVAKSSAYTVVVSDSTILATGTTTITLPTAVGIIGRQYTVKKTDAGGTNVTVAGNGVELIDGANTVVLNTQYEAVTVQSDGTQWWVIGQVATVIL